MNKSAIQRNIDVLLAQGDTLWVEDIFV
jgi:hypothetical protein